MRDWQIRQISTTWRVYTLADGFFNVGISKGPDGWHICLGWWVLTTEVPD